MSSNNSSSIGAERFKADSRTFAGLLLLLGAMAAVNPLANVAAGISPGENPTEGVPLWALIAGIGQAIIGTVAMLVGYMSLVHDYGDRRLTGFLIIITQFAWVPFMVDLSATGMGTVADPSENPFIPAVYNPTVTDVRFVGSMGILAILAYGTGFLGSVSFMEFSLFAYQSGKASERPASYYRSRMNLYMFLLGLAGMTQMLLGIYALSAFGSGPLEPPVAVAVYVVHYPELAIFVGLIQLIMGIWGMARRFGVMNGGADDHSFQIGMAITCLFVLSMMVMTQVSWAAGGMLAPAAPTIATLVFGLHAITAFLDFKARSTPEEITAEYYGADNSISGTEIVSKDEQLPEQPSAASRFFTVDIESPSLEIQA
jgi:hypothetical protein